MSELQWGSAFCGLYDTTIHPHVTLKFFRIWDLLTKKMEFVSKIICALIEGSQVFCKGVNLEAMVVVAFYEISVFE